MELEPEPAHTRTVDSRKQTRGAFNHRTPASCLMVVFAHVGLGALPDHDSLILLAPLLMVLLVVTIVVATALQRRGLLGEATRKIGLIVPLSCIAAGLSLGAAAIHFAVLEEHLAEDVLFGLFFVLVGWFQVLWALAYLLWRSVPTALAGAAANALVVITWVVSRTTGVPFGPQPWIPEPVGLADLLASVLEVALVGLLLPTLLPSRAAAIERRVMPALDALILASFFVLAIALLTSFALVGVPADAAAEQ